MSDGLYGRNYDYDVRHYDRILVAINRGRPCQHGFADRFTGRLDGQNEHGLCVGLHQVNNGAWQPGLACILIVRMVLDQCATTRDAIALLRRIPHGGGYNYSLMDAAGAAAVVEAAPASVAVREGGPLGCSNHFLLPRCRPTTGAIPVRGGTCRRWKPSPASDCRPTGCSRR